MTKFTKKSKKIIRVCIFEVVEHESDFVLAIWVLCVNKQFLVGNMKILKTLVKKPNLFLSLIFMLTTIIIIINY